jgi:hypothetical protein
MLQYMKQVLADRDKYKEMIQDISAQIVKFKPQRAEHVSWQLRVSELTKADGCKQCLLA